MPDLGEMKRVDGALVQFDGWSSVLRDSHIAAAHVVTARNLIGFEDIVSRTLGVRRTVEADPGRLYLVEGVDALDRVGSDQPGIGVIMGIQNAGCIVGNLTRVELLWTLGLRVVQPTYNLANGLADGCLEERDAGLSREGKEVVRECGRCGILLDVSHLGTRSALDVITTASAPVAVTHGSGRRIVDNPRNKEDVVLRELAARGGVIGMSPWGPMSWSGEVNTRPTASDFVQQVLTMVEFLGADAVAIGSALPASADPMSDALYADQFRRWPARYPEVFGAYTKAFGVCPAARYCSGFETLAAWRGLPSWLLDAGLSEDAAAKVLGLNWLRVFREAWRPR